MIAFLKFNFYYLKKICLMFLSLDVRYKIHENVVDIKFINVLVLFWRFINFYQLKVDLD